jgi:hypothetical protein
MAVGRVSPRTEKRLRLRVYLDTSVFSCLLDDRAPVRLAETRALWNARGGFDMSTSVLARAELERTHDPDRRDEMLALLDEVTLHPITAEMNELAVAYVDAGVFTPLMVDDATHVSAAVLTRQDILVSWNFRHLVNRRRRAMVNEVNVLRGLPQIEIVAPPEL